MLISEQIYASSATCHVLYFGTTYRSGSNLLTPFDTLECSHYARPRFESWQLFSDQRLESIEDAALQYDLSPADNVIE